MFFPPLMPVFHGTFPVYLPFIQTGQTFSHFRTLVMYLPLPYQNKVISESWSGMEQWSNLYWSHLIVDDQYSDQLSSHHMSCIAKGSIFTKLQWSLWRQGGLTLLGQEIDASSFAQTNWHKQHNSSKQMASYFPLLEKVSVVAWSFI